MLIRQLNHWGCGVRETSNILGKTIEYHSLRFEAILEQSMDNRKVIVLVKVRLTDIGLGTVLNFKLLIVPVIGGS